MQTALTILPVGQRPGVFGTALRKPAHAQHRLCLTAPVVTRAAAIAAEDVPDVAKRVCVTAVVLSS